MTQVGQQNHYNIKFLKGYGVSIRQKDQQIILANGKDVFTGEQEKDGKLFLKFKVLRNTRLRSSILFDDISEIGKIKSIERQVNLNADKKRFWLGEIESIDSKIMNESMPISTNHFKKDDI